MPPSLERFRSTLNLVEPTAESVFCKERRFRFLVSKERILSSEATARMLFFAERIPTAVVSFMMMMMDDLGNEEEFEFTNQENGK